MSLRPVTKSRRRGRARYANVHAKKWSSNWQYEGLQRSWRAFDPSQHRKGLLTVLLLSVIGFGGVWVSGLSHGQTIPYHENISKLGPPAPGDPQLVYVLWHATAPNSNLGEFVTTSGAGYTGSCLGTSCMDLHPSSSQSQVAISKSPVADLSVAHGKQLLIDQTFAFSTDSPFIDGSGSGTCSTCSSVVSGLVTTGTNDLVVAHFIYQSGSLTSANLNIHDTSGATWTQRQKADSSPTKMVYWYSNHFPANAADTINVTSTGGSATGMQLSVYGISCSGLGDCNLSFDPNGGTICSGTSTTPTCAFGPTLTNQQIAIGPLSSGCGCTPTVGAGFTAINRFSTGGGDEYQVYTGSTTSSVTWTITSAAWVVADDVIDAQVGCCPSSPISTFGWFLTTNSSLPTHAIGSSNAYNPRNDPSVVLLSQIYTTGTNSFESDLHVLRTPISNGTTIGQEDIGCITNSSSSGSCFLPAIGSSMTTGNLYTSDMLLNFTGGNAGGASCNWAAGVAVGAGCSFLNIKVAANNAEHSIILPWFTNLGAKLYIGYYSLSGNAFVVRWAFDTGGNAGGDAIGYGWNCTAGGADCGNLTVSDPYVGAILKGLIAIGVFILNAILGFVSFITPAIQSAIGFLETQITSILNAIGNALGFGNVGSDLQSFVNTLINFFTQQLPQYIGDFPSYFTNFISLLQIQFPFLAPMFTIANAIIAFGTNGIAQAITILTIGLQMFLFGYGTLMWIGFIIYTGDDALGGFWAYLGTLEYLSFKILNLIALVTNLGIDLLVHIISLIPKPFIQMNAGRLPRLPVVESSASMTFPKLDFAEARNGNLLVFWLWAMGVWFGIWFESRNPSLPGSLGALDPAIAANMRLLSNFLPLMQAVTLVSGGLVLAWFALLPMKLAGIDVTESPIGVGLGRVAGPGPGGISVKAGKKHLRKTIRRQLEARETGKAKKVEAVKGREKTETARKELASRPKPTSREEARFGR